MEYRALFRSELKQQVLRSLLRSDKKLSEVTADVDSTETTVSHILKEFEKLDLTTKISGVYSLSFLGRIEAQICEGCYQATEVLDKFKAFWLTHDVGPIPSGLMLKLGMLQEATIVKSERSELGKVHETFLKMMVDSKKVLGTSPIFHPDFVNAFKQVLNAGGTVELILTNEVLNKTFENILISGDGELYQKFVAEGRLEIYLVENLKIALTVTENIFSMGLFHLNGQYDYSTDIISVDSKALQWGEAIFHDYLKHAKKVEL